MIKTTYNSYKMGIKEIRKTVGKQIRKIRKNKGLTQEKLGERADLCYKFLGEVERGNSNISLDSLVKISKALEIEIGDLFKSSEDFMLSKLSPEDVQVFKKATTLLNKIFIV